MKEKLYIKQEISWHVAEHMISFIGEMPKLMEDEEFRRGYEIMDKAIGSHLGSQESGDIVDIYAIVELNRRGEE